MNYYEHADCKNIPHKTIRDMQDRSWTMRLLHLALTCPDDVDEQEEEEEEEEEEEAAGAGVSDDDSNQLEEIIDTLAELDDPRTLSPLTLILEDCTAATFLRNRASDILCLLTTAETAQDRRRWWASGDKVLMDHAVRVFERTESDLILPIASNPNHPYHGNAIGRLQFGFEEPQFQAIKIAAMQHPDPVVRECAAHVLLWDQPVDAEEGLIQLAQSSDEGAAEEALTALGYYDSQSALSGLVKFDITAKSKEHQSRYRNAITEIAESAFYILEQLEEREGATAVRLFKEWLEPINLTLNKITEEKPAKEISKDKNTENFEVQRTTEANILPPISEILDRFKNPDRSLGDEYNYIKSINWKAYSKDDKGSLIECFSTHTDWSVRDTGCTILAQLDAGYAMKVLLDDPIFIVRKSAGYNIKDVTPDAQIADRLWSMIACEYTAGCHASELIDSYIKHAKDAGLNDRLLNLAQSDLRESIRHAAIRNLSARKAIKHIEQLIPILYANPLANWGVHTILLAACVDLGLTLPNIEPLTRIDSTCVQAELARYKARQLNR
ncbi:MAG: HEAT repeat domain-containing protein [Candidatus Obscuribacter sp.]|nr:HEAT repeat domain-containing protein [Candidatus Obscuribacter sp.]